MPTGRPSKYQPEFCEEAIDFLSQGYSTTALAGHLGVARATLYGWMDAEPEFLDAVKVGQAKSAVWWEDKLQSIATTGQGNATSVIFGLKNRATEDWRDITRQEVTGKDGGPIQTEETSATDKLAAFLAAKSGGPTGGAS